MLEQINIQMKKQSEAIQQTLTMILCCIYMDDRSNLDDRSKYKNSENKRKILTNSQAGD